MNKIGQEFLKQFTVCALIMRDGKKIMRIVTLEAATELQAITTMRRSMPDKPFFVDLIERFEVENLI